MSARNEMTMRAVMERDAVITAGTEDVYGHDAPPDWQSHITVACLAYSKTEREVVDDKRVIVQLIKIMFPIAADVTNVDRVANVKDRRGATLFAGPLTIQALERRRTHLEATCRALA